MGKRTLIIIVLCTFVVLAGAIAAAVVLNERHQHAEQVKREAAALAAQAKAADDLGSEFDSVVTTYTATVAEIDPALEKNAKAVKWWKKTWAKRSAEYRKSMAKYRRELAAVKAYNNSPAGHVRWIPNVRTSYYIVGHPGTTLYEEPSIPRGDVWWSDGEEYSFEIDGYLTKRPKRPVGGPHKLPRRPKAPEKPFKIQDPFLRQRNSLALLKSRLDTLAVELASAELGPEFLPVADEIRNGIQLLRTQVDQTLKACRKAVRRDRRMGYVAVQKKLKGVDVAGADEAVLAVRVGLVEAARTHDVDLTHLTWAPVQP